MAKRPVPRYDFKAFGAAIKAAREGCKESRKKVGDEIEDQRDAEDERHGGADVAPAVAMRGDLEIGRAHV